jgi:hypothetical protein
MYAEREHISRYDLPARTMVCTHLNNQHYTVHVCRCHHHLHNMHVVEVRRHHKYSRVVSTSYTYDQGHLRNILEYTYILPGTYIFRQHQRSWPIGLYKIVREISSVGSCVCVCVCVSVCVCVHCQNITNWHVRSYMPAFWRYAANLFMLIPSMHRCNLCTVSKILIIQQCNITQTWIIHFPRSIRSNNNQIDPLFAHQPFKTEPLCSPAKLYRRRLTTISAT